MMTKDSVWVVIADAHKGRLLQCGRTERGSAHVETVDNIEHDPGDYEHQRPSPRKGGTGDTQDDHENEEESRRFARRLTGWMQNHVVQHNIAELQLFAAPRFLGTLRKLTNGHGLPAQVETHEGDLTNLTTDELTKHRRIQKLLGAA